MRPEGNWLKPEDKLYWSKFASALIAGYMAAYISHNVLMVGRVFLAIMLAAFLYVVATEILSKALIPPDQHYTKRKAYLNGLGTYIGSYLASWIIFFNLMG